MTRVLRDIVYAEVPGFRPLALDLHLPPVSPAPVVVFLHGGGWMRGSRRTFWPGLPASETFERVTAAGWAVASVDYRLSSEAVFPAQLDDVRAGIEWVRSVGAAEHGLDSRALVVWGESAGAHLAGLAGLSDPEVHGVIAWYGPSDLLTMPQAHGEPTRESALIGGSIALNRDRARAASPRHLVHEGAPAFLLAHGHADSLVPVSQSIEFAQVLEQAGVEVQLQLVPGADHMWRGLHDPATVFDPALAFLAARLQSTPLDAPRSVGRPAAVRTVVRGE